MHLVFDYWHQKRNLARIQDGFTTRSVLRKVLFLTFLFVYEISREPLNRFTPNSQGRRTVYGNSHGRIFGQGQKSNVKVTRDKNGILGPFGGLRAVYVW